MAPSSSRDQQQAAGIAYAAKKGEVPKSKLKGASKQMYEGMSKSQLRDYAKKREGGGKKKK